MLVTTPSRRRRRTLSAVTAGMLAVLLVGAQVAVAANATNINIQLPSAATSAFSIAGAVKTSTGAPVKNAFIFASGTKGSGFAQTATNGSFKVTGLKAGSYAISVTSPTSKNLQSGYYKSSGSAHFTPKIALASKITVGPNKTGIVIKLPVGLTISGTVKTAAGAAVAGATVGTISGGLSEAQTSATGKFTLTRLSPGTYKLGVGAPTTANLQSGYYKAAGSTHFTTNRTAASAITVGPNKSGLVIKLPAGFSISGVVSNGSGPEENVRVVVSSPLGSRSTQTAADGSYSMLGLTPGSYKLQATPTFSSPSVGGWFSASAANHYAASQSGATGIVVGPNRPNTNLKLPLGFTISGTITAATGGAPVEFANVSVDLFHSASTDASGHYTIVGLAAGSHTLNVSPGYGDNLQTGWYSTANPNHFVASFASTTPIVLAANKTGVDVKLPTGATISGKITGPGGTPVQFASVQASGASGFESASTATDGTYTIIGLSPGTYTVYASTFGAGLQAGYYKAGAAGNFTPTLANATGVAVAP